MSDTSNEITYFEGIVGHFEQFMVSFDKVHQIRSQIKYATDRNSSHFQLFTHSTRRQKTHGWVDKCHSMSVLSVVGWFSLQRDAILILRAMVSLPDLNCSIPKQETPENSLLQQYGLKHSIIRNLFIRNSMEVHFREVNTCRKNSRVIANDSPSRYSSDNIICCLHCDAHIR